MDLKSFFCEHKCQWYVCTARGSGLFGLRGASDGQEGEGGGCARGVGVELCVDMCVWVCVYVWRYQ